VPPKKTKNKKIKDTNVRAKTTEFLKENTGVNVCDVQSGNGLRILVLQPGASGSHQS
jgi:hypothetical protein